MKSQILRGQTWHCRYQPRRHAFTYRMIWLCIDVDELPTLNRGVACFGYNRPAPVSISDTDYAGPGDESIRDKVIGLLARDGVSDPIARIDLITLPKVFGYVFNPVSFFRCYREDGHLVALLAEVHNTFGETHHYVLRRAASDVAPGEPIRFQFPKAFYVSPFCRVDGEYQLLLEENADSLSIEINLRQNDELVMTAGMSGRGTPMSTRSLMTSAIRLPFIVASVMPRITWQALQLYFRKRIPVFTKPEPASAATIPARRSSVFYSARAYLVRLASTGILRQQSTAPVLSLAKENPL